MGELILKYETKFKKLTWHALIGRCKIGVLHWSLLNLFSFENNGFLIRTLLIPHHGVKQYSHTMDVAAFDLST